MDRVSYYYFYGAAAATAIAGILHLTLVSNIMRFSPLMGIFFLVAGVAQLFWTVPTIKRWGRDWQYIGIAGTIVLIILFFVTRVPNPVTGGRALPIIPIGIATEVFELIYVGVTAFILKRRLGITGKQKEQLR